MVINLFVMYENDDLLHLQLLHLLVLIHSTINPKRRLKLPEIMTTAIKVVVQFTIFAKTGPICNLFQKYSFASRTQSSLFASACKLGDSVPSLA